jgi:hypothetical protein
MTNRRTYVRVYDDLNEHPAWEDLDLQHVGLWVLALGYCSRNLTDGLVTERRLAKLGGTPQVVLELAAAGRLHLPGHDCGDCPEVGEGQAYVHGYLDHQRSREQAQALSSKRAEAGRKGGQARPSQASDLQGKQGAKQVANQTGGNAEAETETERKKELAAAAAAEFETWWSHYPNKRGKQAAAKAYAKARKTASEHDLAQGLLAAIAEWRAARTEPQFIPHPTTWLNQGRWADEVPTIPGTPPAAPALTLRQCEDGNCPSTRHEWADARNRYACMGA